MGFIKNFFFLFDITWCMCCQDYGLCYWWGVLFFCLCTTTYLCVAYGPYTTYPFIFSFLCSVCSFLYPFVPLCFQSYHLCIFSCLDENFWGCVGACILYAAPYMYFEVSIHLKYFCYSYYH